MGVRLEGLTYETDFDRSPVAGLTGFLTARRCSLTPRERGTSVGHGAVSLGRALAVTLRPLGAILPVLPTIKPQSFPPQPQSACSARPHSVGLLQTISALFALHSARSVADVTPGMPGTTLSQKPAANSLTGAISRLIFTEAGRALHSRRHSVPGEESPGKARDVPRTPDS